MIDLAELDESMVEETSKDKYFLSTFNAHGQAIRFRRGPWGN